MKRCLNCMEELSDHCSGCPQCGYEEGNDEEPFLLKSGSILGGRYIVGTCRRIRQSDLIYIGWDALFERKVFIQEFYPALYAKRKEGGEVVPDQESDSIYKENVTRFVHYHRNLIRLYKEEDIINVYSCFEENGTAYATMQYWGASTLKEWIGQGGEIDKNGAMAFLYQAAQALKKVHALGLIHGDIGLDSFFVTGTGGLILKDFAEPYYCCKDQNQTDCQDVGPWIDVYGLSMLFGSMLLKEEGLNASRILTFLSQEELSLPVRILLTIKKGLGEGKSQRIDSLEEFSDRMFEDEVTMQITAETEEKREEASHKRRRRRWNGGILWIFLAAVCILGAIWKTRSCPAMSGQLIHGWELVSEKIQEIHTVSREAVH